MQPFNTLGYFSFLMPYVVDGGAEPETFSAFVRQVETELTVLRQREQGFLSLYQPDASQNLIAQSPIFDYQKLYTRAPEAIWSRMRPFAGEADHSMRGLLGMMLKQGAQAFSEQVNQWMVDQGWVTVTTKKGLFGVESQRLEADPQEVAAVKQFVLAVTTGEPVTAEQLTLAQVLLKTELLYECFDRQEAKAVKTGLLSAAEQADSGSLKLLETIDQAVVWALAAVATVVLS